MMLFVRAGSVSVPQDCCLTLIEEVFCYVFLWLAYSHSVLVYRLKTAQLSQEEPDFLTYLCSGKTYTFIIYLRIYFIKYLAIGLNVWTSSLHIYA